MRYLITSQLTRKLCSASKERLESLTQKYMRRLLSPPRADSTAAWEKSRFWPGSTDWTGKDSGDRAEQVIVRLRELFFPMFERIMYELVFDEELPDELNRVICASAENVIEAIKGGSARDMKKRRALTCALEKLLIGDKAESCTSHAKRLGLDPRICAKEWALFLQGVFFTTAVVQLSEGAAHIGLGLAQKPDLVDELRGLIFKEAQHEGTEEHTATSKPPSSPRMDGRQESKGMGSDGVMRGRRKGATSKKLVEAIVTEAMRLWPLFGDAHRITSEDIKIPEGDDPKKSSPDAAIARTIAKGTVLIFNYPKFHAEGASKAYGADWDTFEPKRWVGRGINERQMNYIPFGVTGNRPCPGKRISLVILRAVVREMVELVDLYSPVDHTRSLPCGGLCIVRKRSHKGVVASQSGLLGRRPPIQGVPRSDRSSLLLLRSYIVLDNLSRSFWQLVNGAYMLWESKQLRLAQTYFKTHKPGDPAMSQQAHKPCPTNQLDAELRC